jgi:hypothetical protein
MREPRSTALRVCLVALIGTVWAACGQNKPNPDGGGAGTGGGGTGGPPRVTISGTAMPHPLNAQLGATDDFSMLKVAIVNPTAVLVDPAALPLGAMNLDTTAGCASATGCAWSLSAIDISNLSLGLVGTLEDLRTGDARLWVKTGTGMGTAAFLTVEKQTRAPITDRRAFAVSRKLEAKLAAFASGPLGTAFAAGDLEARGFLIGHVVGKLSEGPEPAGVAGATVMPVGAAPFDVLYPNATFTATGNATAASGIFLVVPRTAMAFVASCMVVAPAGETRTWDAFLAGSNPANAFIIILPANE